MTNSPKKPTAAKPIENTSKSFDRVPRSSSNSLSLKGKTPRALRSRTKTAEAKEGAEGVEGEQAEDCKIQ